MKISCSANDLFYLNILLLAVGCKHTGYKSLMAGLVTEWIYNAFAGKYLISGKYLFTENTCLLEILDYGKNTYY